MNSVEKWWNEICGRGKQEKPRENPSQTLFPLPRNTHGQIETRTRDPSGWRRAPNRLRHGAARVNDYNKYINYVNTTSLYWMTLLSTIILINQEFKTLLQSLSDATLSLLSQLRDYKCKIQDFFIDIAADELKKQKR